MSTFGLDLSESAKVAQRETFGEWYRDPWSWPELKPEFISEITIADLASVQSGSIPIVLSSDFHSFAFPKSFLGTRPAVVMDAPTRILATASSMQIARQTHEDLHDWVFGWRYRDGSLDSNEWEMYSQSQSAIGNSDYAAQTDITSFFASVENGRLTKRLEELCGRSAALGIISQSLDAHDKLAGRSGLPQRSIWSSWLAHVAMQGIDDLLGARWGSGKLRGVRRWMDDISFEGSKQELHLAILDLQERGRQVGLEINALKTDIAPGPQIAAALERERQRHIRVPRLDQQLRGDYFDIFDTFITNTELGDAEDKVLRSPESASRTEAGLVLRSLRHYWAFDRVGDWMKAAPNLPHAADHLSRFLVDARENSMLSPDVAAWFVKLQNDEWHYLPWVRAQHSLAVPSEDADDEVKTIWMGWLEESDSLQQVAAATQRLATSATSRVRSIISTRIDHCTDPLLLRVLALGLLAANGDRHIVEGALTRNESNSLTLAYLSRHNWRLPTVSADFDPPATG